MTPEPSASPSLIGRAASLLALPIAALLWLQWPLRDLGWPGSSLTNDTAQALFALYVSVSVAQASRARAHLVAHPQALARSRWRKIGAAVVPLPWCLWVFGTSVGPVARSVAQWEGFPETANPGYFLVKLALLLLSGLLAAQCVRQWRQTRR